MKVGYHRLRFQSVYTSGPESQATSCSCWIESLGFVLQNWHDELLSCTDKITPLDLAPGIFGVFGTGKRDWVSSHLHPTKVNQFL